MAESKRMTEPERPTGNPHEDAETSLAILEKLAIRGIEIEGYSREMLEHHMLELRAYIGDLQVRARKERERQAFDAGVRTGLGMPIRFFGAMDGSQQIWVQDCWERYKKHWSGKLEDALCKDKE